MKITALLPMKGFSERVPKKNLRLFNGNPLYHLVLKSLIKSNCIDNIVINTDCDHIIKDVKLNFSKNIIIHNRPESICGNYTSMNEIINYDINKIDSDLYIQTHSTNPLLNYTTIDLAIEKFLNINEDFDSLFSVSRLQKRFYDKNVKPFNHDPKMLTTQHLDPIFEENSCLYIFTKESFNKNNNRIGSNPLMFELNKVESIDIDNEEDFEIAELIYKSKNLNEKL